MTGKIKQYLLYFIFTIMLLPLAEQQLRFIDSGTLKGGFKEAVDSVWSIDNWANGSFQAQHEKYLNDHVGFRADIVRLTDQIDYSCFDICHAIWTLKGKDKYLFQSPYIRAYYGEDYIGYPEILKTAVMLKDIQDTLARLGKSLILVYLPSKASSYPEYFPDSRVEPKKGITNHDVYRHISDSLGINQVDMDEWFVSLKNKSEEPLFSKQGIHWTTYGAILGGDSLTSYIEQLRHVHVQHPLWSQMVYTDKLRGGDDDVAQGLNLIFPVTKETLAYPVIKDVQDNGEKKINAIYIGDSYAHKMVEFGIIYKMNGQCEFWSYFDEMHDINGHKFAYIKDYDWKSAIRRADCVVLAYTSFNFTQLGNDFIQQAHHYYYPQSTVGIP